MNRYEASKIVVNNWRLWNRLPRITKLAKFLYNRSYLNSMMNKLEGK